MLDRRRFEGSSPRMTSGSEIVEVLEEEPVTSKTHDHQLESDPNTVEACSKPPASLEMTEGVSRNKFTLALALKEGKL